MTATSTAQKRPLYLMIDNYDSFTFNLVQLFGMLGVDMVVHRNDAISLEEIGKLSVDAVVISPGPCTPDEAGISMEVIGRYLGELPILGVCLGHQSIGQQLGCEIVRAPRLLHGKTSPIFHDGSWLFRGVENPFLATRYHSLVIAPESLVPELKVIAKTWEDEIMAVAHREHLCVGVQFHPESILTEVGPRLMGNFVSAVEQFWGADKELAC